MNAALSSPAVVAGTMKNAAQVEYSTCEPPLIVAGIQYKHVAKANGKTNETPSLARRLAARSIRSATTADAIPSATIMSLQDIDSSIPMLLAT
jgi:hypothetical protein